MSEGWNEDEKEVSVDVSTEVGNSLDEFPIIKNATMPGPQPKSKYPFEKMVSVDDAFIVKTDNPKFARPGIYSAQKRIAPDIRISTRTVEGGIHVQRVE